MKAGLRRLLDVKGNLYVKDIRPLNGEPYEYISPETNKLIEMSRYNDQQLAEYNSEREKKLAENEQLYFRGGKQDSMLKEAIDSQKKQMDIDKERQYYNNLNRNHRTNNNTNNNNNNDV